MERRRERSRSDTLSILVAGGVLGILIHEAHVLEKVGVLSHQETVQEQPTTTSVLTTEERTKLYGTQKLFICQIPDEHGVLQTVEINVGGPETPLELAEKLQPEISEAIILLSEGINGYNELEPAKKLVLDTSSQLGVRAWDYSVLSTTQLWGVKDMTVTAFSES